MATLVSDPLRYIADQFVDHCGYASAVLSGLVPDRSHLDSGGYHCSVNDLRAYGNGNDYSNTRADDRNFNPAYCAAVDVSMNTADMIRSHGRLRKVWADTGDPRRKYLNAVNTWDGSGDAVRLDFCAGTATFASADHKWHVHLEVRRRHLLDMNAARAIVSVLKGEPKADYLNIAKNGDDMSLTEAEAAELLKLARATNARIDGLYHNLTSVKTSWSTQEPNGQDVNVLKQVLAALGVAVGGVDEAVIAGLTASLAPAIVAAVAESVEDVNEDAITEAVETGVRNVLGSLDDQSA